MLHRRSLLSALGIAVLMIGMEHAWAQEDVSPKVPATQPAAASVDPRAVSALKLMSDTLSQAKSLQFQARSMTPLKSPNGMWISLYGSSRVVKEGSGKLFVETRGDLFPYDFYFDSKLVTAYSPTKNLYAEKAVSGTVDDVIEAAYLEEGKSFPYADILVSQPYEVLTRGLVRAAYVGQSDFQPLSGSGSVQTDHFIFSNEGVEWQIWIDMEDHLPRMVCATYLDVVGEPSYTVEFGDWKLDAPVPPETFKFQNVSQAAKVEFRNPMQQGRGIASGAADKQ
ncbi:MAG: DUF2092 domain-containing protein [Candidatus Omnitrophota bacterium]